MTKNNPGTYDCYAAAEPDEPMFVLLGRDPDAPGLVDLWACIRERLGERAKAADARAVAAAMRSWLKNLGKKERSVGTPGRLSCSDRREKLALLCTAPGKTFGELKSITGFDNNQLCTALRKGFRKDGERWIAI